jgi:hypothetical protein
MRRPTIKGRGREIFFPEPKPPTSTTPHQNAIIPARQHARTTLRHPYGKVTLWLPLELIRRLDSYWLKCRREDRKATKSGIASKALDRFLREEGQET